jgi:hypothetical protein
MRQHVVEMVGGPGTLRFLLQPAIAVALGILHGLRDRRAGLPPYLSGLRHARGRRLQHLGAGLRAILVPLCIALLAAFTFQYVIRSRVYVFYGLLYATLFVAAPYLVTRELANRLTQSRPTLASRT